MFNRATHEVGDRIDRAPPLADGRPSRRLSPRLKQGIGKWLAVVLALNVALGMAYSVVILRRDGDRHRDVSLVIARMERGLGLQDSFLETASARGSSGPMPGALIDAMRSLSTDIRASNEELRDLDSSLEADMAITEAVDRHLDAVVTEIDRLEDGDATGGSAVPTGASSDRLAEQLSASRSANAKDATDAFRTAEIESILMMGLAALMAVLLQKKFNSARRAAIERSARDRARGEERFRSLVQNTNDVILICDEETVVKYQTPSAEAVIGFGNDELIGLRLTDLVHVHDMGRLVVFCQQALANAGKARMIEFRMQHRDDHWMQIEAAASNLMDDPNVKGLVLTLRDISAQKSLERQLQHQAFHDSLTSLANRALFSDRVEHALVRSDRSSNATTVLFVDVDDFKTVNDSLGHAAGDELLIEIAKRLQRAVRPSDTVARLGGDEFAVLLEDVEGTADARVVAERILGGMEETIELSGRELIVRASIGIANSGAIEGGAEELLRNADVAMYMAKDAGKATYVVFEPVMHAAALNRLEMRAALEQGVSNEEFLLHYQPIVDLETGRISGLEALVRWRRGDVLVPPLDFIPLAEETGVIHKLGEWVLNTACRQAMIWQKRYPSDPPLGINVNVSARQILQRGLVDIVDRALKLSGLDPRTLTLEITENDLVLETDEIVARLIELKRLGVRLAIDDFGTGYSSLSYLGRFPVDVLKIDRSFMTRLAEESDPALTEAVVQLGQTLSLEVVAEGIEDAYQQKALRALNCGSGQGFLFSRPLDEAAFESLMDRGLHPFRLEEPIIP